MNSTFDHFGGGGFMETNNFQSPSNDSQNQGGKKVYKAQNCVPVSIRQILESTEDNFKIGKQTDVHLVTIVGLLVKKESDSTKLSYLFDDYTGKICAYNFTYNDAGVSTQTDHEVGQYYRVFGSVRISDGKHHIMTFKIEPLESLDELTMHLLEVVFVPLSIEEQDVEESAGSTMPLTNSSNGNDFRNSMMQAGTNGQMNDTFGAPSNRHSGLTAQQNMIFQMIKNTNGESGLDTSSIPASQISRKELEPILEFLTGEGHIYSTIDEFHYKTTDV